MEEEDEILLVLRRSRKVFVIEYFCAFLLILLSLTVFFKEISVPNYFQYFVLGIAMAMLIYAEFSRVLLQYIISTSKISIIKGIIKKDHKNIYFRSLRFVPDLNLEQTRVQRFLNYGDIFIESQGEKGGKSMEIEDVDQPKKVLKMIEDLIEKNS